MSDAPAWKYSDDFFKDVLRQAVPERREETDALLRKHGVTISPNDAEDSLRFSVDLKTHEISVATSPLPRIWGHAYAYLSVYDLIARVKAKNPDAKEITVADEQFAAAMSVLKWAMNGDAQAKFGDDAGALWPQAYPADLPLPFDPRAGDPTHRVAGDLVIMALGLILLHEIGHLELGHGPSQWPDSILEEREADEWAASFFLSKCDEYAKQHGHEPADVQRKRSLALVIGELWALHFEVHLGVKNSETHPPTYDRLANLLDQHAPDGADLAWSMAATILSLHYQARYGLVGEHEGFDDFRECYQFYADLLSKKPKRNF